VVLCHGQRPSSLVFGHFHCRVAASEDRPAFQGRSRQPNPIPRRGATDEMANPNGVRRSSAARAARGSLRGHQGTGLERPAYRQAPRCGGETVVSVLSKSHLLTKRVFHGRNFVAAGISIRVVVWGGPKMSKLQKQREQNSPFDPPNRLKQYICPIQSSGQPRDGSLI
jgi:hypothetical protein